MFNPIAEYKVPGFESRKGSVAVLATGISIHATKNSGMSSCLTFPDKKTALAFLKASYEVIGKIPENTAKVAQTGQSAQIEALLIQNRELMELLKAKATVA